MAWWNFLSTAAAIKREAQAWAERPKLRCGCGGVFFYQLPVVQAYEGRPHKGKHWVCVEAPVMWSEDAARWIAVHVKELECITCGRRLSRQELTQHALV